MLMKPPKIGGLVVLKIKSWKCWICFILKIYVPQKLVPVCSYMTSLGNEKYTLPLCVYGGGFWHIWSEERYNYYCQSSELCSLILLWLFGVLESHTFFYWLGPHYMHTWHATYTESSRNVDSWWINQICFLQVITSISWS